MQDARTPEQTRLDLQEVQGQGKGVLLQPGSTEGRTG